MCVEVGWRRVYVRGSRVETCICAYVTARAHEGVFGNGLLVTCLRLYLIPINNIYVFTYVRLYVLRGYLCVYVYTCIRICERAFGDVSTCLRMYAYTCYVHTCVYTYVRVYVYTCMFACICKYTYTCMRTCLCVYVYTCIRVSVFGNGPSAIGNRRWGCGGGEEEEEG